MHHPSQPRQSAPDAGRPETLGAVPECRTAGDRRATAEGLRLAPVDIHGEHHMISTLMFLALRQGRTLPPRGNSPLGRGLASAGYFKMFTARETTSIATTSESASSDIIMSFAQGLIAETSVGLKAVAAANERCR